MRVLLSVYINIEGVCCLGIEADYVRCVLDGMTRVLVLCFEFISIARLCKKCSFWINFLNLSLLPVLQFPIRYPKS